MCTTAWGLFELNPWWDTVGPTARRFFRSIIFEESGYQLWTGPQNDASFGLDRRESALVWLGKSSRVTASQKKKTIFSEVLPSKKRVGGFGLDPKSIPPSNWNDGFDLKSIEQTQGRNRKLSHRAFPFSQDSFGLENQIVRLRSETRSEPMSHFSHSRLAMCNLHYFQICKPQFVILRKTVTVVECNPYFKSN